MGYGNESNGATACVVYHGTAGGRGVLPRPLTWRPAAELFDGTAPVDLPSVLLMDRSLEGRLGDLARMPRHLVVVAADAEAEAALGDATRLSLAGVEDERARACILRAASELASARLAVARTRRQLACMRTEAHELKKIGIALMLERDRSALLRLILDQGKRLTESDGGCLLLLESNAEGVEQLRFRLYDFDSLPDLPALTQETLPVDQASIIGHASAIRQPIVIDDAYALPPDAGFQRNPEFDRRFGYHIRSMLIVPMIDHRDALVGVLVFVNRKTKPEATIRSEEEADRYALPYTRRQVHLARSLAGQAAVSIENANLHARIEQTLESFVKAAVTAIDQRDPTTAGHSVRVAALTTDLAGVVERVARGPHRDVRFTRQQLREMHFAALLHDFGKISVSEEILLKAKKLPAVLSERVEARFDLIRRTLEVEYYRMREHLLRTNADPAGIAALEGELAERLAQVERMRTAVHAANEPGLTAEPVNDELVAITAHTFELPDGTTAPYLTDEELHFLRIPRGTLDAHERLAVQSHVEATYRFLTQIPWTDDLHDLTAYAYAHHEMLDGTGYPRHIRGAEIPIQARMMTIADIFDALTASDRPYKPAVSPERALDIMRSEARAGRLDAEIVDVMVETQVYRRILEEDWRRF